MSRTYVSRNNAVRLTRYRMTCPAGTYSANSWIGLGWAVLRHRLWHLWHHKTWMD